LCGSIAGAWPMWNSYSRANQLSRRRDMARLGAIQLDLAQRSAALVMLSATLRESWCLQTGTVRLPSGDGAVTAGDLYESVWEALVAHDSAGMLSIYPEAISQVRDAIERVARELGMDVYSSVVLDTSLMEVFPKSRRRSWKCLSMALDEKLPAMVIPRGAIYLIRWACVAAAIGLMVVIAQHLDASHATDQAESLPYGVGRLVGRLVLFAIAIPLIALVMAVLRPLVGRFPPHCRTVAQLVGIVGRRHGPSVPMGGWSAETLWSQLRTSIAQSYGLETEQVTAETVLTRRMPEPDGIEFVDNDSSTPAGHDSEMVR
jgi:hypothetical protein